MDRGEPIDPEITAAELDDLLLVAPRLHDLERRLPGFNLFRVLRADRGELRHSNMLAWLLSPDESHGFGDRFLRGWLMRVLHATTSEVSAAKADVAPFRAVRVLREWSNLDIVVHVTLDAEEWVVAVENKIESIQSDDQLVRYERRVRESFPNAKLVLVFLTMRDEEPASDAWIPADYGQVRDQIDDCLAERRGTIGDGPRLLIDHYRNAIQEILVTDPALVALARNIYSRHRRAIDFIVAQREDGEALLSEEVAKAMREGAAAARVKPRCSTKGFVRFLPEAWATPKNLAGRAWGAEESAYLLCEIALGGNVPILKIVEGKSPPEWRMQLFEIARASGAGFKVRAKLPEQWMSVYQLKLPPVDTAADPQDAATKIWEACAAHLASEPFARVSKVVEEHLAKLSPPAEP